MCILALVVPQPGGVLQVAANRDEFLKRPAAPPSIWEEGWLAPRDLEAGGTWLGLNPRGLFVGVTNRAGVHRASDRRSRGLLVTTGPTPTSSFGGITVLRKPWDILHFVETVCTVLAEKASGRHPVPTASLG